METEIRDAIRARIETLGISQAEAARRAGTTPAKVSDYLAGKTDPPISSVSRLADGLGITLTIRRKKG